jgi:hypothetical protein
MTSRNLDHTIAGNGLRHSSAFIMVHSFRGDDAEGEVICYPKVHTALS